MELIREEQREGTEEFSPAVSADESSDEDMNSEALAAFHRSGWELEISFMHIEHLTVKYPEEWESSDSE